MVERESTAWNLYDIILVLILTFTLTSLIFLIIESVIGYLVIDEFILSIRVLILNFVQAILLGGLTLSILKIKYRLALKDVGFNLNDLGNVLKYGIIGGILICLLITLLNNFIYLIIDNLWGIEAPAQEVIKNLLESESSLLFFLNGLLIVIVAPITEEIFFRGFIYPYCKSKLGKWKGILLSALFFALAHASIWLFFPTFLGGIILANIYEKTKSIYSCMLAHGVWNMIIVSLLYLIWKGNFIQ
ncbi:hypothetical protein BX659_10397 [Orenia metallireducens]|jgi:hypothetical protein|uniref:CAAX prenyl protease 2/Lysostaphin resistance protein A-like domain-containing protein n=1 Tax=Orenia metallireducens TaxID=1413210 RepID=A0A285FIB6_9FIRM|nr:type II CAAX endopeptidase family protein [Orenia metallireducens]PRX33570.1 hypothetical protein BX659_10397 [Orenia metallireducens]SNY11039.1 hypothetical protein SAMN06265827_10297 [Orenia metallireducens]